MKIKPWGFVKRLYPDMIWEIDDPEGVYLTFDDGPTPGITEWILSTLKRYDAKATFFVLGKKYNHCFFNRGNYRVGKICFEQKQKLKRLQTLYKKSTKPCKRLANAKKP